MGSLRQALKQWGDGAKTGKPSEEESLCTLLSAA